MQGYIEDLKQFSIDDVEQIGIKNALLSDIVNKPDLGITIPQTIVSSLNTYKKFLEFSGIDTFITQTTSNLNMGDIQKVVVASKNIQQRILDACFQPELEIVLKQCWQQLTQQGEQLSIRPSIITDDGFKFFDTNWLNKTLIVREQVELNIAVKTIFASLYTEQTIIHCINQGQSVAHLYPILCIQPALYSRAKCFGKIQTRDPESGFSQVIFITSSRATASNLLQEQTDFDEFYVYKGGLKKAVPAILNKTPSSAMIREATIELDKNKVAINHSEFSINNEEIHQLAAIAVKIEALYGEPVEIEWLKTGTKEEIHILQIAPDSSKENPEHSSIDRYLLKETGKVLVEGRSIGHRIGTGKVRLIYNPKQLAKIQAGDILVTDNLEPEWDTAIKQVAAIITNRGGRTCHAAIIARERGIPAIVGCGDAMADLVNGQIVTVSCAEGEKGRVYAGELTYEHEFGNTDSMPDLPLSIMINIGNPNKAFELQALPNDGVGLARLEFIINRMIGIHPKAILEFENQTVELQAMINRRIVGYISPVDFYVERLVEGISTLAAAFYPKKVIVRMSDFKSNEYSHLIGGNLYEQKEENPMLGFRGATRYISENFRDCFELECRALKIVRDNKQLTNVEIMIPFVRTLGEAKQVIEQLEINGLKRGENGLRIIMMCEVPSNALLADEFLELFDGFSIGTNDLTQMALGLDRDSAVVAHLFNEQDQAVKKLLSMAINACQKQNKYLSICGQGVSNCTEFASWLMEQQGIDSLSLSPDSIMDTWFFLANTAKK